MSAPQQKGLKQKMMSYAVATAADEPEQQAHSPLLTARGFNNFAI